MPEQITRERLVELIPYIEDALISLSAKNDVCAAITELLERRDAEPLIERTAQLICIVCGVPWPCEYAGKPPVIPSSEPDRVSDEFLAEYAVLESDGYVGKMALELIALRKAAGEPRSGAMNDDKAEAITVGRFKLVRWNDGVYDRIWIGHASGDRAGEGGYFKEGDVEAAIAAFYAEHF